MRGVFDRSAAFQPIGDKSPVSSYKEPSFQERTALANKAKIAALKQLRAKPPSDEATLAGRREAAHLREAKQSKARDEKLASRKLEKEQKRGKAFRSEATVEATDVTMTDEDQKAARDAKYAARKKRKK